MQLVNLDGRKILVTGASSGIGRATAVLLSKLGASLVICGRDEHRLEETKKMMDESEKHRIINFDIKNFDKYTEVFHSAVSDGKKLDGMVHCVGISKAIPVRAMNDSSVTEIIDVNFTSFMCLISQYAKNKYSGGGAALLQFPQPVRIILISA